MTLFYGNKKHLEIISAKLDCHGDIEVLFSDGNSQIPAWLVEYELDWFVVFENPEFGQSSPVVDKFLRDHPKICVNLHEGVE